MSPRKSSTSSGKHLRRPRYLAIEVTGVPPIPPRELEQLLFGRLSPEGSPVPGFRLVRHDGPRSLVEVPHTLLRLARERWNGAAHLPDGRIAILATRRTYGTLVKGKGWLRAGASPRRTRGV